MVPKKTLCESDEKFSAIIFALHGFFSLLAEAETRVVAVTALVVVVVMLIAFSNAYPGLTMYVQLWSLLPTPGYAGAYDWMEIHAMLVFIIRFSLGDLCCRLISVRWFFIRALLGCKRAEWRSRTHSVWQTALGSKLNFSRHAAWMCVAVNWALAPSEWPIVFFSIRSLFSLFSSSILNTFSQPKCHKWNFVRLGRGEKYRLVRNSWKIVFG